MPKKTDPLIRFWRRVTIDPTTGCWIWTGALRGSGYGKFNDGSCAVFAHRFAYERFVGPVPDGTELGHTCDVKRCCNPDHVRPVTHSENMLEAVDRRRFGRRRTWRLKDEQVSHAIDLILGGEMTLTAIARSLGIGGQTVSNINRGVAYDHVRPEVSRPIREAA